MILRALLVIIAIGLFFLYRESPKLSMKRPAERFYSPIERDWSGVEEDNAWQYLERKNRKGK